MAESEKELKSLLMKVKEESEKVGLKLNTPKTKIMASGPITSWQIDRETVADFIFWAPKSLLLKLLSIESVMPSNHLILCRPLLLLPSIFPSIRVFSDESTFHMRWPKYWSFSFSISPSNEYSGIISFRMDWFDLLAVQGTLKSLLQHHCSKHQFFGSQLSFYSPTLTSIHDY